MISRGSNRLSAEERRDAVLKAAVTEFATYGLHGTSTDVIARRAGISQPYVFRLYGTKKSLFIAAITCVFDRILAAFRAAAASSPDDALEAMGDAYKTLLSRREELLLLLQALAAAEDRDVQRVVRRRYLDLCRYVEEASHGRGDVASFIAYGLLLTVGAAIDLPFAAVAEP